MSYKNNHYVPRLVLRRFADKVSVYNIKTGELAENKRLEKVFALSELYSEEVEKELAEKIESPFALILNNKILSAKVGDNIEITRKELNIIKKFLLVSQMRVFVEEGKFSILEKGLTQAMKKMGVEFPFEEREIFKDKVLYVRAKLNLSQGKYPWGIIKTNKKRQIRKTVCLRVDGFLIVLFTFAEDNFCPLFYLRKNF